MKEHDLIRKYTREILMGLEYLHDNHIVHRNLRCSNVFVHPNGHILLTDFGFQFLCLDESISIRAPPSLTPHSMAPKNDNPREDSWRVGLCILEMINGSSMSSSNSSSK